MTEEERDECEMWFLPPSMLPPWIKYVLPLEMMWLLPTSIAMPTMPWVGTAPLAEETTVVTWVPPAWESK